MVRGDALALTFCHGVVRFDALTLTLSHGERGWMVRVVALALTFCHGGGGMMPSP